MSYLREIAEALTDGLDAAEFVYDETVTIDRKNWAAVSTEELSDAVIYVVPGNAEATRVGRKITQIDYVVNVFVGRYVENEQQADDMLDLASEVLLLVRAHDWSEAVDFPENVTSPQSVTIDINPDDALNERNVWRAVIQATYRVVEPDVLS
jgi:hypothetical protein